VRVLSSGWDYCAEQGITVRWMEGAGPCLCLSALYYLIV
jgi:hypothetical protein